MDFMMVLISAWYYCYVIRLHHPVRHRVTLTGFQAVGYEYAVEMTYPLSEVTSATLLNVVSQVISLQCVYDLDLSVAS